MTELTEHIEALRRDPTSVAAATAVREGARAGGALSLYARAFADRAKRLAASGLAQEAIASFIEAALVYEEELEDLEAASSLYRSVLELDPAHRRSLFALGLLLHDLDRYPDLIELYRQRLSRTTDDGERTTLLLYIAEILSEKLGDDHTAFTEVMKAARLAPRNLRIITRLERLGERTNQLGEVAVVIGDLMLHQQDPRVRAGLALRLAELHLGPLDDQQRALAYFRSALADDGGNPELLEEVEDAFRERERFDELAALLEEVAEDRRVGPMRVRLERELARIYELELGDKKRALQALTRAAKQLPDDRELLDEVMRLGLSMGALDVVAATFEEVADQTTNGLLRTYLLLKLAHIYAGVLSRPADAIRAYEAILESEPGHREARRRLGNLCERTGDWARLAALAEEEARSAEVPAEQVEPLRKLAKARRDLEDLDGAFDAYRRILEIAPDDGEATQAVAKLEALLREAAPVITAPASGRVSTDLSRVGASVVATDAPSDAWTELEGDDDYGPEAETQWSADPPLLPPPAPPPPAPEPEDQAGDDLLQALSGANPDADLSMALDEDPSEETQLGDDAEFLRPELGEISEAEPLDDADLIEESAVSISQVLDASPIESEYEHPAMPLRGRPDEPLPIMRSEPPPPLVEDPAERPSVEVALEPTPEEARAAAEAELADLQVALQLASGDPEREAELLAKTVDLNVALGEHERAFFAQVRLTRLDAREAQLGRMIALGRAAKTFGATIATADEVLPGLDVGTRLRLGLVLAELEAGDAGDVPAALARLEALHRLVPDEPLVLATWTELLEARGELEKLTEVLENEAHRVADDWERRSLLRRSAEIRAVQLQDPSSAASTLLAFLSHAPDDEELAADARKYLEAAGRWRDLSALAEDRIWRTSGAARAELRRTIARIALEHLDDRNGAERMLRLALSERPDDAAALEQLVQLYSAEEDWPSVIETLAGQLPLVASGHERAALRRRLAKVAEEALGNPELALTHLEHAVRDDPSDLQSIDTIERLRRSAEDWFGVVEALILAAQVLPDDAARAERWLEAARVRRRELQDATGAAACYRRALELRPDHAIALWELAELCEEMGEPEQAILALLRLAELGEPPARASAHLRAGRIMERVLGKADEAAVEYEHAIDADAACVEALAELARHREERGEFEEALSLTEREADLTVDERRRSMLWTRAAELARVRVGDAPRALVAYEHALQADPDDLPIEAALGELSLDAGDAERAFLHLTRAARGLRRSDRARAVELYVLAGRAAERLGQPEQAVAAYDSALELAPRDRAPLERLAILLGEAGHWDRAYELNATLLLHHEHTLEVEARAQLYLRMAEAKRSLGDRPAAIRLANKSHALDPDLTETLDLLASALEEEEQPAEAAELLRRRAANTRDDMERRAVLIRAAKLLGDSAGELGKAVAILGELHAQAPHDVEIAELLATHRERAGELRGAASALATAARTLEGRPRADLLVRAARVAASAARERGEARRLLAEAVEISATHREGVRELAIALELDREWAELAKLHERAGREFLQDAFTGQDAHDGNRTAAADRCFEAAKHVYRFRLSRPLDALRMVRAQREIDPERPELLEDLARILDEAALSSDAALASAMRDEALVLWSELVEQQPGLIDGLRRSVALRLERGDRVGARIAADLLELFGAADPREQRLFELELDGESAPSLPRLVSPPAVDVPLAPEESSVLEMLFNQLGYAPLNALADALPEPQLRRRDRVQLSGLGVTAGPAIEETCSLFGVPVPLLYVRDDALGPIVPAFTDGKPALVVSLALASRLPAVALRFHAGHAVSLLRSRALSVTLLPLDVLREGLEGLVRERGDPELMFSDVRRSKRRGKSLERELSPSARIGVLSQVTEWLIKPNRSTLFEERAAVLRTADRAGLIACGSLKTAVTSLEAGGKRERSWLMPLIRFAASRQYLNIASRLAR